MILVKEVKRTNEIKKILRIKEMGGGHYCHNIELLSEVKDGPYKFRNILKNKGIMVFYVVYDDDDPVIIAPIFKKKKQVTVAGTDEFFDYTDWFYPKKIEKEKLKVAFYTLMNYLKRHGAVYMKWNYVPEESLSREFLKDFTTTFEQVDNTEIPFSNYSDYFLSLSKSTKQNLRTAENRLKRDNKKYELLSNLETNLSADILQKCIDIYCKRQREKYRKSIFNQAMIKTFNYSTEMLRKQKGLIMVLTINDDVASFMFGYINSRRKSYEVPKLAISEKYAFYSPGMLLVNKSIQLFADKTDIRILDLCRGTEQYKIKMGGEIYHTYNYKIDQLAGKTI